MLLKRAEDIMVPLDEYPHLPYWFTLRQAMVEMERTVIDIDGRKSSPRAVLVFDEAYRLLGLVRRRNILFGLESRVLDLSAISVPDNSSDKSADKNTVPQHLISNIRAQASRQISEVMIPIEHTVAHDDHLVTVMEIMVENNLNLLPVMANGSVAGVIRTVDIFHEVSELLL